MWDHLHHGGPQTASACINLQQLATTCNSLQQFATAGIYIAVRHWWGRGRAAEKCWSAQPNAPNAPNAPNRNPHGQVNRRVNAAEALLTVGGSCLGSPAMTTHCAPRVSGMSVAGSVACVASSTTTMRKARPASARSEDPVQVAHTTCKRGRIGETMNEIWQFGEALTTADHKRSEEPVQVAHHTCVCGKRANELQCCDMQVLT